MSKGKYYFKLWYCLDLNIPENERNIKAENIIESLDGCYGDYQIDNEGILKVDLMLEDIKEIFNLGYILNDDIVTYGSDYDILMTKKTMQELGLS